MAVAAPLRFLSGSVLPADASLLFASKTTNFSSATILLATWFVNISIGTSPGGSDMLRITRPSLLLVALSPELQACKRTRSATCDEASWATADWDCRTNRNNSATDDQVNAASDCLKTMMNLVSFFHITFDLTDESGALT